MIEVKDVSFTYPAGVKALKNINLSIKKGEVLAIIGQNGSGKTTLVKHFNGLLKPIKGEVLVNDKLTSDLTTAELSRIVGYVFQNPDDQIFNTTVAKEVGFGPKNFELSKSEINKRVKEALSLVGLSKIRREHPLDLSLNDKKLIAIASIIAMKPEVIILDEPTTGQDHEGIKKIKSLIKTLSKDHTVIIISHNMELVAEVVDRVVVMFDKEVIFDGKPSEAFNKVSLLKKTFLKPPLVTQLARSFKELNNDSLTINDLIKSIKS